MSVPRIRIDFGSGLEDVALPYNWAQIKFEVVFTDEFPSSTLQSILFEWRGEVAGKIIKYFNDGLTGGTGIGEGIPMEVSIGNPLVTFPVIINLADASMSMETEIVKAPIKRVASIDWFHDTLEGITFTLLEDVGLIGLPGSGAKYTYKKTPYVVTIPTDIPQAIMLLMEEVSLFTHAEAALKETTKSIKKLTTDFTVLSSDPLPAAVPITFGNCLGDVLSVGFDVVFDTVLGLSIIKSTEMIINQFGIVKKYKYCMTVRDQINSVMDYINSLGVSVPMSFKSTIFTNPSSPYYNLTTMPKKSLRENSSLLMNLDIFKSGGVINRGTEVDVDNTYGYYDYDAKRFISELNEIFNAKGSIIGNVFNIEEVHHFNKVAAFQLPNTDKPEYNYNWPAPNGTNWSELNWYYRIAFGIDSMDERTSIVYTGTSCAVTIQPKLVKNQINILAPTSKDITFAYSLAKRKEYLNVIENVVNDLCNVVSPTYNLIVDLINGFITGINIVADLVSLAEIKPLPLIPYNFLKNELIGCMETSGDQWEEPKLFIGTDVGGDWQIHPNNGANNNNIYVNPNVPASTPYRGQGYVSAFAFMQQFHGLNLATRGNQWLTYARKTFPIGSKNFITIINNNIFTTADGKFGKFDKLLWVPADDEAQDVEYKINQKYTNNLVETISIDGN